VKGDNRRIRGLRALKGKAEFFANLRKEMRWFLSRIDAVQYTKSVLDSLALEVNATFTLHTKKPSEKPAPKTSRKKAPAKKKKKQLRYSPLRMNMRQPYRFLCLIMLSIFTVCSTALSNLLKRWRCC
jgi:hypothetical protein